LFRNNYDRVLLLCLKKKDANISMKDLHDGLGGGHFPRETTAHKVLRAGYYWPKVFKDAHAYSHSWYICRKSVGREIKVVSPLQHVVVEEPFE
jgi:hypothetical protein